MAETPPETETKRELAERLKTQAYRELDVVHALKAAGYNAATRRPHQEKAWRNSEAAGIVERELGEVGAV